MIFPEDIDNWFTYHACQPEQISRLQEIRAAAKHLAQTMVRHTPDSSDQFWAIMKLRESVALANAAIACEPKEYRPKAVAL